MTETENQFQWHPDYAGQSFESVERDLAESLRRDQSAYQAALANAEREEFGSFTTIRELERRWSQYDLSWAELDPDALAQRIGAFERARDEKHEMFSWQEWRATEAPVAAAPAASSGDWRENLSDEQRRKIASALAIGVIGLGLLLIVVLLVVVL